jgi:succinate dehydrogenase / fumarate reductase membrane anchor subunit
MALLLLAGFDHCRLGLQVVSEDYQHGESRVVTMILLNLFTFTLGGIALFAILKVAFSGAPA